MNIYIKEHKFGAGKWIYNGYYSAWKSLGYNVEFYKDLRQLKNKKNFYLMALDGDVDQNNLEILNNSKKTFLFTQPNLFPHPWGRHPNFQCFCPNDIIEQINKMDNVKQWTFGEVRGKFHYRWKNVKTVLLAFDSINYNENITIKNNVFNFDVCFIGGRANNGFDEKYRIMKEVEEVFSKSKIKSGIFIDMNLSHEEENTILHTSKVSLNIHDAYQRKLGLDTNERTFKSLGTTGILISDSVKNLEKIFPNVKTSNDANILLTYVEKYVNMSDKKIKRLKEENKELILNSHTYVRRVEELLKL